MILKLSNLPATLKGDIHSPLESVAINVAFDRTLSPVKQQTEAASSNASVRLSAPLIYILHCGNLFGTERMALETLDGLGVGNCITISPDGPLLDESAARGHRSIAAQSSLQLVRELIRLMRAHEELVFFSTTVVHAFLISFVKVRFEKKKPIAASPSVVVWLWVGLWFTSVWTC